MLNAELAIKEDWDSSSIELSKMLLVVSIGIKVVSVPELSPDETDSSLVDISARTEEVRDIDTPP